MSVRDAAKGLIHNGKVDQGILNMVEMAFRAYDPVLDVQHTLQSVRCRSLLKYTIRRSS